MTDDRGYVTTLTSYPERIISIAPSNTEILFALGLDDKVVGITEYCNYPYNFTAWFEAGNITNIGGYFTPNMEAIVSLEPDLLLAAHGMEDLVDDLREVYGYKVLILDPKSLDDVLNDFMLVGRATNSIDEATALVSVCQNKWDAVNTKIAEVTSKPTVYYETWYDPIWTIGSETWENGLIEAAGGINIFVNDPLEHFSTNDEAIIQLSPEVILLPFGHGYGPPFWGSFTQVKERPGWSTVNAVQNDNLYEINADMIARSGPRAFDVLGILAEIFHPN